MCLWRQAESETGREKESRSAKLDDVIIDVAANAILTFVLVLINMEYVYGRIVANSFQIASILMSIEFLLVVQKDEI